MKKITGIVSSDKQDKTIVITETSRQTHPLYGKQYTRSRKYAAHDEKNLAKIGDKVEIVETRPISRTKSFQLGRVIEGGHAKLELKEEEFDNTQGKPVRSSTLAQMEAQAQDGEKAL